MSRSFWDAANRRWVAEEVWKPATPYPPGPIIMPDIKAYRSPIDRTIVSSRPQHKDHLKKHRVVEMGDSPIKQRTPTELPPLRETLMRAWDHTSKK